MIPKLVLGSEWPQPAGLTTSWQMKLLILWCRTRQTHPWKTSTTSGAFLCCPLEAGEASVFCVCSIYIHFPVPVHSQDAPLNNFLLLTGLMKDGLYLSLNLQLILLFSTTQLKWKRITLYLLAFLVRKTNFEKESPYNVKHFPFLQTLWRGKSKPKRYTCFVIDFLWQLLLTVFLRVTFLQHIP